MCRFRHTRGFTLIEWLVVVAIIALLISILLPSLGRARAQARATMCASRISQLVKAIFLYADDYGGTPPFMGRGWENADDPGQDGLIWPKFQGVTTTVRDWKYFENWIMPNMPDYWTLAEIDWPPEAEVRNGSLFRYTRFESVYLCPDFERVSDPSKSQNTFNYTRTLLGRKWYHQNDPEGQEGSPWYFGNWAGAAGPIMQIGQIYSPSRLHMLFGERWNRHCAAPPEEMSPPAPVGKGFLDGMITGQWMVADPMLGLLGNEIGQYHGQKMGSQVAPVEVREFIEHIKRANSAFYDGHVALELDPLPDRLADLDWGFVSAGHAALAFVDWTLGHIFAQRGPTEVKVTLDFP